MTFCDDHIEEVLQKLGGRNGSEGARRIEDLGFFGGFFWYFCISTSLVNLNTSVQNLAPVSNMGWMLSCLLHLWSHRMNSKNPREVGRNSSSSTFFFSSPSRYLETAALITANNLGLIFSLSNNVMIYQQLEQNKYCKKFFCWSKLQDPWFFLFVYFLFLPLFSLCHNKNISVVSCFYSQNCAKGMIRTALLPGIHSWFDWGEIRSGQECHWNSGTNCAAPWDA